MRPIDDTVSRFIEDALIGSGLAVLDGTFAFELAPSRWPTERACAACWAASRAGLVEHARKRARHLGHATVEDRDGQVLVAAMSRARAGERLGWILGRPPLSLAWIELEEAAQPDYSAELAANMRLRNERLDALLRELATVPARLDALRPNLRLPEALAHEHKLREALPLADATGRMGEWAGAVASLGLRPDTAHLGAIRAFLPAVQAT